MAGFRQIHVSIWQDEWFLDLEPEEKLLFIYFFSNQATSISGLYKVALKVIAFETGLDPKRIKEILKKFGDTGKVYYDDGIVWVVNMRKYHSSKSETVLTHVKNDLELIPNCKLKTAYQQSQTGADTLSIPYTYDNHTDSQLNKIRLNKINNGAKAPSKFQEMQYELANYFMQVTGLQMPEDYKAKQKLWWTPAGEIYKTLAQEDMDKAKEIVDRTIQKMGNLTIADMNSIIKTARAIAAEDRKPDPRQYAESY